MPNAVQRIALDLAIDAAWIRKIKYRIAATASGALREVARRGGGDNNIPSSVSVGLQALTGQL